LYLTLRDTDTGKSETPLDNQKPLLLEGVTGKEAVATGPMKVSIICDAILAELKAQYPKTHTQSILTAHLSKIPPDIPAALRVIAELKGSQKR
jgi:elongator complex protein 1